MTRPTIVDTFMFNNELDILQMRLEELYNAVDHFVLVEAKVDHQDHPKPLHYAENRERFKPWADKIVHVIAGDMPTKAQDNDPWAREHAQREFIADGVARLGLVGRCTLVTFDQTARYGRSGNVVTFGPLTGFTAHRGMARPAQRSTRSPAWQRCPAPVRSLTCVTCGSRRSARHIFKMPAGTSPGSVALRLRSRRSAVSATLKSSSRSVTVSRRISSYGKASMSMA
jgi:hypothetical protein